MQQPIPAIFEYLQWARFHNVAMIEQFEINANLISVLVEQWIPETHTFLSLWGVFDDIGRCRPSNWALY